MSEEYSNIQTVICDIADWKNTPSGARVHELDKEIVTLEKEIAQKRQEKEKISAEHIFAINKVENFVKSKAKEILEQSVRAYRFKDGADDFWNRYGKYLSGARYELGGTMQESRLGTYFYSVDDCSVFEEDGNVIATIIFIEAQGATDCPDEIFWYMTIPVSDLIEITQTEEHADIAQR